MTHDEFNQYCQSYTGTTYVMQWGNSHIWKVGEKVFAIGTTDNDGLPAYTFKTSDLNYDFLKQSEGYRPAPYLASRGLKWIQQTASNAERDEELRYYLSESYRLVSLGLTKKKQKALGVNQDV
ncbi:MmcQ/YjbR family DNA-binding protein [Alteromonas sp. a30]|uniref:MmcQ/YjbR family DNA-binding protein n=1 Tax=Alteromonas sp. a30 TaxID=2730917 RepID=UPI00227FDC50|nr:MmcQ/YjbR family DNA-binding protein [Alteromonas sp. a30]MCY7296056.1 MmcQ/YjbR family DNA-binding protein [Alteromonas sp. a30]